MGFYEELIGVIASSYQASSTWTMVLSTSGTGTATSRLVMYAASATTATLDGTGRFYSDSAGTLNESATWTLATGWNTIYVKVSSGSSNLLIADRTRISKWGQSGATAYQGWVTQTNSPSLAASLNDLGSLSSIRWEGGAVLLSGDWSALNAHCTYLSANIAAGSTCSGTWTLLPTVTALTLSTVSSAVTVAIGGATSLQSISASGTSTVISGSVGSLSALASIQCATGVLFKCSGNLSALSSLYNLYAPTGSSSVTYTSGHTWGTASAPMSRFYFRSQLWSNSEGVALVHDLASGTWVSSGGVLNLRITGGANSTDVAALVAKGVSVTISTS